ncbi:MAG: hypothetical protein NZ571_16355 [Anaerolineae bacterium]|nr:hypothetical protein [Anaerolineae bacterium]
MRKLVTFALALGRENGAAFLARLRATPRGYMAALRSGAIAFTVRRGETVYALLEKRAAKPRAEQWRPLDCLSASWLESNLF